MRNVVKGGLLLIAAVLFGLVFSPLLTVTIHDALLDFLDGDSANKVTDYFRRTEHFRAAGITLLLLLWAGIVIGIDRVIDFSRVKPSANFFPTQPV